MIKLKSLLEGIDDYEFVGFHRQKHKRPSARDDLFLSTQGQGRNYYGKTYFREILDSLYEHDKAEAMRRGWLDFDWSNYHSDQYEEMEDIVADWLNKRGYRWLFVTEKHPHDIEGYGDYIYKIYIKKKDALCILDDPYGANDIAYAYVYHIRNLPKWEIYDQT